MARLLVDRQRRLRLLLGVMALLALVSAGVNYRRWQTLGRQGDKETRRQGDRETGPSSSRTPAGTHIAEIDRLWRWTAAHPEDTSARLELARRFFVAGRFAEAETQLTALVAREPKRAEYHYWLSLVRKQDGRLDEALASIERACRLDRDNQRFPEWLGQVCLAQGRAADAASVFDTCLKRWPDSYAALLGKARAMEQLYEEKLPIPIPDVVTPVEKAVRLDPRNPEGVSMLARLSFVYLQQFERAAKLAEQSIAIDPHQASPYLLLVEISLNSPTSENRARAIGWAREAVRLDPSRPEPLYLLGRVLLRDGDLNGAIDAFERSIRVQMMPAAVYQLSLAYARAGNSERARHYSRLYQSWTQFSERRKVLLAKLQRRPGDVGACADLAELYLNAGAHEPAANWARKGLRLRPGDGRLTRVLKQATGAKANGGDGRG